VKDKFLKDRLLKHFWAQQCFVQAEVDISYTGGLDGNPKLITDVDVYALRPHPSLRFERVLGDCRTLKGQSPISRTLWLRGLMTFTGASAGCVLLSDRKIETDHKLAANHVSVLLATLADFDVYDRATIPPEGSARTDVSIDDLGGLRNVSQRFPRVEKLTKHIYQHAWQEPDFGSLIRHTIGEIRLVAKELDPAKQEHLALVVDAAATLCVGMAECAGCVFRQYLQPEAKAQLSEALKALIWGGHEQYAFYQKIRRKLTEVTAAQTPANDLELPEWNTFVQVIRNILEAPMNAFTSPWVLKSFALDVFYGHRPDPRGYQVDPLSVKFAMLVLDYCCKASGLHREFAAKLIGLIVSLQSDMVTARHSGGTIGRTRETLGARGERSPAGGEEGQPLFAGLQSQRSAPDGTKHDD
jgi:hypothetical protein